MRVAAQALAASSARLPGVLAGKRFLRRGGKWPQAVGTGLQGVWKPKPQDVPHRVSCVEDQMPSPNNADEPKGDRHHSSHSMTQKPLSRCHSITPGGFFLLWGLLHV